MSVSTTFRELLRAAGNDYPMALHDAARLLDESSELKIALLEENEALRRIVAEQSEIIRNDRRFMGNLNDKK